MTSKPVFSPITTEEEILLNKAAFLIHADGNMDAARELLEEHGISIANNGNGDKNYWFFRGDDLLQISTVDWDD